MTNFKKEVVMKKFILFLSMLSIQALLVGCAKSSDSTPAQTQYPYGVQNCQAGMVSTQYGCLPTGTGSCQAGFGYSPQYGCVPPSYNNGTCQAGIGGQYPGQYPNQYPNQYGTQCGAGGVGGTCQAGQVGTVMGCLPQGSCPTGYGYYYGMYNGQNGGWCYMRTY
jgi:hypothetical protein